MSAHALFTRRDDFNRGNLSSSSFCKPCAVLCLDLEESLDGLSLRVCVSLGSLGSGLCDPLLLMWPVAGWDDEVMLKTVLPQAIADRPVAGSGLRCWVDMGSAEGSSSELPPQT